jgi:ribose/xylose/arabinose/galactoside ABC-type transport system permease subunit
MAWCISELDMGMNSMVWFTSLSAAMVAPAYACPVCGFGRDGTTSMYLLTAAFMSLVPLLMAGAISYYLIRRSRRSPSSSSASAPHPE